MIAVAHADLPAEIHLRQTDVHNTVGERADSYRLRRADRATPVAPNARPLEPCFVLAARRTQWRSLSSERPYCAPETKHDNRRSRPFQDRPSRDCRHVDILFVSLQPSLFHDSPFPFCCGNCKGVCRALIIRRTV